MLNEGTVESVATTAIGINNIPLIGEASEPLVTIGATDQNDDPRISCSPGESSFHVRQLSGSD